MEKPRPAATVVVAREGQSGVEVLMVRRARANRFAPGFVVFPGGVVGEWDPDLAERWFGDPAEAHRACAVRELAEEAGLVVTADGLCPLDPGADRLDVIGAAPPRVEQLPEMARWVAPEFLPTRFDARFFSVRADGGATPRPDGVEVDRAWWATPADVLEEFPLWESLMWPTFCTLEALRECRSVEEVLRLRVEQRMVSVAPDRPTPEWFGSRGG